MPNLNTQAFLIPYADTGNRKKHKKLHSELWLG